MCPGARANDTMLNVVVVAREITRLRMNARETKFILRPLNEAQPSSRTLAIGDAALN